MPSRSSSRSSNPSEDNIKFSWKDQLSPRLIGLRGFRRASESTAKMRDSENRQFTMMHFPDRPTRRITEAEIPSEEECKQYLIRMRKASFAEQLQRRKEEQEHHSPPPPEPPLRSTFGPFTAPFLPLTPAQEEESPFDTGAQDDNTATGDFLRVPDDDARISNITEEGFNLARENSPQPVIISEAKTVRLERVDNLSPGGSPDASPTSSPRVTEVPREWSKRKQSVQMVAIQRTSDFQKRKQSVQTVLIRRPSRAVHDALNSHPVHPHLPSINVHIRQDSSSDLLCRVCHVGLAENSGTCSTCGEEYSVPTSPSQSHHDLPGANFSRPQYKQPQPQPIKKYHRPPPLIPQSLDSIASLHRPSASLTSDPEANQLSPPPSPRSPSSATHPTQKVLTIADAPPTPLSALPTPEVLKRFQQEIDSKARAEGGSMFGDPWNVRPTAEESKSFEDAWDRKESGTESDVYEDDWADYYFDEGNFDAGRRKQTKVTTPEVQGFMQRELSLDEYDGAFASPVNPGPGWI